MTELEPVIEIAREAGRLLIGGFSREQRIEEKDGAGIVTEFDRRSEALILERLRTLTPDASFLAEESFRADSAPTSTTRWLVDPLDGTSNYAAGFPWFAVSIALEIDARLELGVVYHPILDWMFSAERGKGASLNGKRIRVSDRTTLDGGLLGTGFHYHRGAELKSEIARFQRVQDRSWGVRRAGAAALDLAFVALGTFDGFWEKGLSPWDVGAGLLLVDEAGGRSSDYSGALVDPYGTSFIASNGLIHDELLELVGTAGDLETS